MQELINDPFYKQIKSYNRCIIDYCLIENDIPYQGYRSHKDAILFSMCKIIERYIDYQLKTEIAFNKGEEESIDEEPFPWSMDIKKATAKQIDSVSFLHFPKSQYDHELQNAMHSKQIPYWYAFCETPHKTGYNKDDFNKINSILFPNGAALLEIYEWTTDWSNYFDDGHEWWGAACWSVYDRLLNRYVVIMASTTD